MRNITQYLLVLLFIQLSFSCKHEKVYLSDLKQGFIANEFGPPEKDRSYNRNKITLHGRVYEKGLGVVPPSEFNIDLNKQGIKFHAVAGLDDETMPQDSSGTGKKSLSDFRTGGMVRFHIYGDGKSLHSPCL